MHRLLYPTSLCIFLLLLAGCGSSANVRPHSPNDTTATETAATEKSGAAALVGRGLSATADPEVGRAFFHGEEEPDAEGFMSCKTCHYADPEKGALVGPNLAGIAERAGSQVPGQSAEEYLQISIIDHNAHIVEGFQKNVVLNVVGKEFGEILQPDDIDHLVAYMMTLEEGVVVEDE